MQRQECDCFDSVKDEDVMYVTIRERKLENIYKGSSERVVTDFNLNLYP
jgi:hypothetical protein